MTAVERDLLASGVRLRASDVGEGGDVVLVHGAFVDRSTWSGVVAQLQDRYRLVTPDLPGFGDSEKPPPSRFAYGVEAFAEAIADLYAGLGISRAALVGHGLGGAVCLAVAARHPELVSSLTLIDAWCYPAPPAWEQRLARTPFVGGLLFKQLTGRASFRSFFQRRMLHDPRLVPTARIDAFYSAFNTPAARSSALATLRGTADLRQVFALTSRVSCPTLVVWGRHDEWIPAAFGQRLSREIRGAGFELLDAGHLPQEEQPEALASALSRFLSGDRPSKL